jgi:hypothetical protein
MAHLQGKRSTGPFFPAMEELPGSGLITTIYGLVVEIYGEKSPDRLFNGLPLSWAFRGLRAKSHEGIVGKSIYLLNEWNCGQWAAETFMTAHCSPGLSATGLKVNRSEFSQGPSFIAESILWKAIQRHAKFIPEKDLHWEEKTEQFPMFAAVVDIRSADQPINSPAFVDIFALQP